MKLGIKNAGGVFRVVGLGQADVIVSTDKHTYESLVNTQREYEKAQRQLATMYDSKVGRATLLLERMLKKAGWR